MIQTRPARRAAVAAPRELQARRRAAGRRAARAAAPAPPRLRVPGSRLVHRRTSTRCCASTASACVWPHDARRRLPAPPRTADFAFVRLHHGARGRRGNYSEAELREVGRRALVDHAAGRRRPSCTSTTTGRAFAPRNALLFQRLLGENKLTSCSSESPRCSPSWRWPRRPPALAQVEPVRADPAGRRRTRPPPTRLTIDKLSNSASDDLRAQRPPPRAADRRRRARCCCSASRG